ncbi:MAG: nucleotide exchange factor GrpE [bacterium JZ-2024 1]
MRAVIPPSHTSYRDLRRKLQEWRDIYRHLKKEYQQLEELFIRERSTFQAFKKRAKQEKEIAAEIGQMKLLQAILPVVDDLERALFHSDLSEANSEFSEGIRLIYQKLVDILGQWGVKPLESVGEKVDPKYHEVVETVVSEDKEEGTILAELEKGYTFQGMLLRPARVVVSRRGEGEPK